jgi:flagellar biosynthesis protein FlhG
MDVRAFGGSSTSDALHRLLSRDFIRSVTMVGARSGVGRTVALTNIAGALAGQGRSVLLLDQNRGRGSTVELLGLSPGRDLLDVIEGRAALADVLLTGPRDLRVVSGAQAFQLLGSLPPAEEEVLTRAFRSLRPRIDYILVDAPAGDAIQTPSLSLASQEVIIMVSPRTESITGAYSMLKRLSWDFAKRRFHILANRVRSAEQGEALYENIARTARRFLNLSLEYLGAIPEDDALRKACRRHQLVIESFPRSSAAIACRMIADLIDQWPYPGEDCLDSFVQRLVRSTRGSPVSEQG